MGIFHGDSLVYRMVPYMEFTKVLSFCSLVSSHSNASKGVGRCRVPSPASGEGVMGLGEGVAREKFEGQNQVAKLYIQRVTLPETNIAPKNGWLEYYFPIRDAYFQVPCVFWGV